MAKNTQWGTDSIFINGAGKTEYPHTQRPKLDPYLTKKTQNGLKT